MFFFTRRRATGAQIFQSSSGSIEGVMDRETSIVVDARRGLVVEENRGPTRHGQPDADMKRWRVLTVRVPDFKHDATLHDARVELLEPGHTFANLRLERVAAE